MGSIRSPFLFRNLFPGYNRRDPKTYIYKKEIWIMAWYQIIQLLCVGVFAVCGMLIVGKWIAECIEEIHRTETCEYVEELDITEEGA